MKKSILLFVAVLISLTVCLPVYANQLSTSNKNSKFEPIKWRITQITGGFSINNETSKSQFVQVALSHGAVATHKKALNHADCEAYLSDTSVKKSIVCELAPSETLYIDKEFNDPNDATGTYQIAIID